MTRRIALLVLFPIAALGGPAIAETPSAYADDDIWILEDSTQDSLENAETNQTTVWENPDTGTTGSVTPAMRRRRIRPSRKFSRWRVISA